MNILEVADVLNRIDVGRPNWHFWVEDCPPHLLLHLTFLRPDRETGAMGYGKARPCILTARTEVEVVQAALGMVLAVEEHEARERFLFDNKRVFDPHRISF